MTIDPLLQEYELLHILDFNNVRKRMSVILRQDGRLVLLCKGADSVIYDRLSSSQHDMKARTQDHLNVSVQTMHCTGFINEFSII